MPKIEKYGFVYIWRDRKHSRYYIGCHWGTEDDGYICSSTWMRKAYKRRPQDFKRRILSKVIIREKLYLEEQRYLNMIKKEEVKTKYYNIRLDVIDYSVWSDTTFKKTAVERMKQTCIERGVYDNVYEHLQKWWAVNPHPKGMLGKKASDETKKKMSEKSKGRIVSEETRKLIGKKNSVNVKKLWEDPVYRQRMSDAHKTQIPWNKGLNKNREKQTYTEQELVKIEYRREYKRKHKLKKRAGRLLNRQEQ